MRSALCAGIALSMLAGTASAQFTAPMPPHLSTFSGSTRGYYFTAPTNFRITGVQVMLPTGSTNQFMNFSIVRFDNNTPPPLFSATTNAFEKLAGGLDLPTGSFAPVNVQVFAGDVIGIYGNSMAAAGGASGTNSYGNAPGGNFTEIFGNQVALFRSGMQFHLGSNNPTNSVMHDIWAEGTANTSNITRIEFQYIPAPAAAGLLGLAGLVALRRRR